MREVMLDVMRLRFDLDTIVGLERFLHRRRAADIFDFLRHQLRMWPVSQDKAEPAQIVHAWFAIDLFELSKCFPVEERFALTSQIRRSSRSICLNLREAWAKRRYEAHFVSKLTDCDGENGETDSSLDFARDCGYISPAKHAKLTSMSAV